MLTREYLLAALAVMTFLLVVAIGCTSKCYEPVGLDMDARVAAVFNRCRGVYEFQSLPPLSTPHPAE